ncbi:MAG: N-acetylneuraminate synthase family protein [Sulfuritalea sp.]|nr:N-acetylneuraminate synthase family protein [Sulfuritalea sp.]
MTISTFNSRFDIDGRPVGEDAPVYIIAEAGIAHFGSEEKALRLVDLAADAGADAVKFQVYDVDAMIAAELAEWKQRLGSRQLPYAAFDRIQAYCRDKGITFFATAHDEPSLDYLTGLQVPVYKIGSGEVGNWPFLARVAALGKPLIFSTGMYLQEQVGEALQIIAATGNHDVAVLHCVTDYPAAPSDIALGNLRLIREHFQVITGYSDHTAGYHIPLAAVAMGARIIEKHITLDYNVPNAQDWKVSCGPDNLKVFVSQVRDIEAAVSTRTDGPTENEKRSMLWASKSLVTRREIAKGQVLQEEDLCAKRPGNGIPPSRIGEILGRIATRPLARDVVVRLEDLQ